MFGNWFLIKRDLWCCCSTCIKTQRLGRCLRVRRDSEIELILCMYGNFYYLFLRATISVRGLWSTCRSGSILQANNSKAFYLVFEAFLVFFHQFVRDKKRLRWCPDPLQFERQPVNLFTKSFQGWQTWHCKRCALEMLEKYTFSTATMNTVCVPLCQLDLVCFACFCCLLAETWTCPELQLKQLQSFMVI